MESETRNYPSNCGEVEKNITSTRATPRSRRKVSNISVPVGMYATTVTELHSQTTPETHIRLPSTTLTCVRPCTVNHPSVCGSHRRSYELRVTIFVRGPAASLRFPDPFRRKRGSGLESRARKRYSALRGVSSGTSPERRRNDCVRYRPDRSTAGRKSARPQIQESSRPWTKAEIEG